MIALTYFQTAIAITVILWIGSLIGVFVAALCHTAGRSSCTGDCNQGRNCTCREPGNA